MPDNKENRNSPDSRRINVNESYELRYWAGKLGVSEDRIRDAVKNAGTSVERVREFLNTNTRG